MPATRKKPIKTRSSVYDVAEHLRTPEEMAAYLDASLDEAPDDVSGNARALGDIARAKGMSQVAKEAGLSRESLYRALSANGNPSFATVLRVAARSASGSTLSRRRACAVWLGSWEVARRRAAASTPPAPRRGRG